MIVDYTVEGRYKALPGSVQVNNTEICNCADLDEVANLVKQAIINSLTIRCPILDSTYQLEEFVQNAKDANNIIFE